MAAIQGNPELDFKEQNPIIGAMKPFVIVYDKYKQDEASKICWSMFMLEETNQKDNPLARIPTIDLRIAEVKKHYYDIDITTEEYKSLVTQYRNYILTKEENLFKIQSDKFEEMIAAIHDMDVSTEAGLKLFMSYMASAEKLWQGYDKVKQRLEDSKKTNIRGNEKLSRRQQRGQK